HADQQRLVPALIAYRVVLPARKPMSRNFRQQCLHAQKRRACLFCTFLRFHHGTQHVTNLGTLLSSRHPTRDEPRHILAGSPDPYRSYHGTCWKLSSVFASDRRLVCPHPTPPPPAGEAAGRACRAY